VSAQYVCAFYGPGRLQHRCRQWDAWLQCAVRLRGTELGQAAGSEGGEADSGVMHRRPVAKTPAGTRLLFASSGDVGVS
jgi:hypothetical protein